LDQRQLLALIEKSTGTQVRGAGRLSPRGKREEQALKPVAAMMTAANKKGG